ncbi:unnamed protein product [Urochloa humidicola]
MNIISASGSVIPSYLLPLDSMASPGSDDGASASASTAAAVCCMCGDRGLPDELFRCNICRLRLQHRYCSNQYPTVLGPYRSCNWCLIREDGGGGGRSPVKAPAAAGATRRPKDDSRDDDDRDQEDERASGGGCTRSVFSPDPEKPVKKKKPEPKHKNNRDDRAVRRPVVKTAAKKRKEAHAGAGSKTRFRVKVRRYKLLAEVIC